MDEGTRPIRLRGTPAGKQRHRACALVLAACMAFGFLLEYKRKRGGYYDQMIAKKAELTTQQQMQINTMFMTPRYTVDGVATVDKRIAADAEDVMEESMMFK